MRAAHFQLFLALASSASIACTSAAPTRASSAVMPVADPEESSSVSAAEPFALDLSPELEPERQRYRAWIELAARQVTQWFSTQEIEVAQADLVRSAAILADRLEARRRHARLAGLQETEVSLHFSGALSKGALIALSPELSRERYHVQFQDYPWSDEEYTSVLAHEIAHAAHAQIAERRGEGSQGIGPRWFLEGLAVACGAQFDGEPKALLDDRKLEELIQRDARTPLRLPTYGQMFRSVAARIPLPQLLDRAAKADFAPWLLASLREGSPGGAGADVRLAAPSDRPVRPATEGLQSRSRARRR